jgi:hypothetical protein
MYSFKYYVNLVNCIWKWRQEMCEILEFPYREKKSAKVYFTKSPSTPALQRVYAQTFYLAQKSNQNTWFSATLVFSLDFRWLSAVSPTLCTVVSKKTKLSCFGGLFSLVFEIQAFAWFSRSCLHAEIRIKQPSHVQRFCVILEVVLSLHRFQLFLLCVKLFPI